MISHKYKCIFVHIPRTGGTSIETAIVGKDWKYIELSTKHIMWYEAKQLYSNYWDKYFKFSVVRNTWDWLVSLYVSDIPNRAKYKTWNEYIRSPSLSNHEQQSIFQSEIVGEELDLIIDFSQLQQGFNKLCDILGIHVRLPHIDKTKHNHYRYYYNQQQKEIVYNKFQKDINRFNWKF